MTQPDVERSALRERAKQAADQIARMRDEVRVQLHLARMDAQDAWKNMEPELKKVERDLEEAADDLDRLSDEAELKVHLALMDARERFQKLSGFLVDVVQSVRSRGGEARAEIDRARLKAHLASMDAEDVIRDRTERVRARLREARASAMTEAQEAIASLDRSFQDLRKRLSS